MLPSTAAVCPGDTRAATYVCAGQLMHLPGLRLVYYYDGSIMYAPCRGGGNAPPSGGQWAIGPAPDHCYFQCSAFNAPPEPDAIAAYLIALALADVQDLLLLSSSHHYQDSDVLPFDARVDADRVCTLLPPPPPTTNRSGDDAPSLPLQHQHQDQEGRLVCDEGWFALILSQGSSPVCAPCPVVVPDDAINHKNDDPSLWWRFDDGHGGGCAYTCQTGVSFPNPDTSSMRAPFAPCLPCTPHIGAVCTAGMRINDPCTPDPCVMCSMFTDTKDGAAVMVATNDSVCRIRCRGGFYTILPWQEGNPIVSDAEALAMRPFGWDPTEIDCVPCVRRPFVVDCPIECPMGTLRAPANDACVPCADTNTSSSCPLIGTFKAQCDGTSVRMEECIWCRNAPSGFQYVAAGSCDIECLNDHGGHECTPCSMLPMPSGAPYWRYAARWDALPTHRWWPAAFDPLHLPPRPRSVRLEPTAAVCWPVQEDFTGFVLGQLPIVHHEAQLAHGRRRLLDDDDDNDNACFPGAYPVIVRGIPLCAPCPHNMRCPDGRVRQPCPLSASPTTTRKRRLMMGLSQCPPVEEEAANTPGCRNHRHRLRDPLRDHTCVPVEEEEPPPQRATAATCTEPHTVPLTPSFFSSVPRCVCAPGYARDRHDDGGQCALCPGRRHMGDAVCAPPVIDVHH
jgi:hypothetical protein